MNVDEHQKDDAIATVTQALPQSCYAMCTICSGNAFVPGPYGRLAKNGFPPRCAQCGSLERHRIVRRVYEAIPQKLLESSRALQFSDDMAAPKTAFRTFEVSQFGICNSLDLAEISRDSGSYDWIIANHVLEHVENDKVAIQELLRITSDAGVVQLTVPSPSSALETWDISSDVVNVHQHRRGYGSDLPLRFHAELRGCLGLQVIGRDFPTNRWDVVYFFFKSRSRMLELGKAFLQSDLPTLRCM